MFRDKVKKKKAILSLWRVPHALNHVSYIDISLLFDCQVVSTVFFLIITGYSGLKP